MKIAYLYFLVGSGGHEGFFKIGISARPFVRQGQLKQSFNLEKSFCLGYSSKTARENERWFHNHFASYQVGAASIGNAAGNTEWFRMECFDSAVEVIEYNEGFDGHKSETGVLKIEKEHCRMNIEVPTDLYMKIKLASIENRSTVQSDVLGLLKEHYGE